MKRQRQRRAPLKLNSSEASKLDKYMCGGPPDTELAAGSDDNEPKKAKMCGGHSSSQLAATGDDDAQDKDMMCGAPPGSQLAATGDDDDQDKGMMCDSPPITQLAGESDDHDRDNDTMCGGPLSTQLAGESDDHSRDKDMMCGGPTSSQETLMMCPPSPQLTDASDGCFEAMDMDSMKSIMTAGIESLPQQPPAIVPQLARGKDPEEKASKQNVVPELILIVDLVFFLGFSVFSCFDLGIFWLFWF